MNENDAFLLLGAGIGLVLVIIAGLIAAHVGKKAPRSTGGSSTGADEALAAKAKFKRQFGDLPELTGVGVGGKPGDYHVAVRLTAPTFTPLPGSIDGVPIVVEIVGHVRPQ